MGEFQSAKLPAEISTWAPLRRISFGSVACSRTKRWNVPGLSEVSTKKMFGRSANSRRITGFKRTVVSTSTFRARWGITLRRYVRPPPALAARPLINNPIIGWARRLQNRLGTDWRIWKRRRLLEPQQRQEQDPRVEMQKPKNTRRDMNPPQKANPRRSRGLDPITPPWPAESSNGVVRRFGSSTRRLSIRSTPSPQGAQRRATHPTGPPTLRWSCNCCHAHGPSRRLKQTFRSPIQDPRPWDSCHTRFRT